MIEVREKSEVRYGQEHGKNLIKISKKLIKNQELLRLLINTDLDPLNKETNPRQIDGITLLNKNILFVPLLLSTKEDISSKIVLIYDDGEINSLNSDNENISLLINIYCPFKQWQIVGDDLRPFAIMSEVRKSLQGVRINGLGELKYLGFSLSTLTEEMGSYVMRFTINAFS